MSFNDIASEIAELIPGYLKNRKSELSTLKDHLNTQNLLDINKIGHKLAGNAGSYHCHELGKVGEKLESCNNLSEVKIILDEYEKVLTTYCSQLGL